MDSNTTSSDLPSAAQGVVFDLGGLYTEFEKLSDKRKPRGKRYPLALVLVLVVLAELCGEDLPSAIAQWISERACCLITLMGLACHRLACLNTLRRVLQGAVDCGQLQEAMNQFLHHAPTLEYDPQVAIDGKALRSSPTPGLNQVVRLLAAYAPGEGEVLFQVAIPGTESELTVAPRLLQRLDLRGKIVMGDALFTQPLGYRERPSLSSRCNPTRGCQPHDLPCTRTGHGSLQQPHHRTARPAWMALLARSTPLLRRRP